MSVRVFAPAKINLTLEVGAPHRATGRHPLQSVVVFADVGDWVEAAASATLTLAVSGRFAPDIGGDEDNLVLRAARALAAHAGRKAPGAALRLEKNLPVASGIGGGSADAAATLKALNALWGLGLAETDLMKLGQGLGGDVPVCVFGRSAYVTGEGEAVAPLGVPQLDAVLVNPGVAASTAAVFRQFDAMAGGARFRVRSAPDWLDLAALCTGVAERGNMLQNAARVIAPAIEEAAAALRRDGSALQVGLSGSGATMFALCASAEAAKSLAASLSRDHPAWWTIPARFASLTLG